MPEVHEVPKGHEVREDARAHKAHAARKAWSDCVEKSDRQVFADPSVWADYGKEMRRSNRCKSSCRTSITSWIFNCGEWHRFRCNWTSY